jgi:hypothetical protein
LDRKSERIMFRLSGRIKQLGEVAAFNTQRGVHGDLQAFIDAGQDVALGRIIAVGLFKQHRGCAAEDLHAGGMVRAAAGDFELVLIPGLLAAHRVGFDQLFGFRDDLRGRRDLVDDALRLGRIGVQLLALKHDRSRVHHADQARQALRAAAARQDADEGFGQAQLGAGVIGHHAVVAGQGDFKAAAQRQAVDGRRHRLAAGFQIAQRLVEAVGDVEERLLGFLFRLAFQRAHAAAQLAEVRAGAEGFLARGDHRALDGVVIGDLLNEIAHLLHDRIGEDIHRHAGAVEGDEGDAVGVDLEFEVGVSH